LPRLIAKVRLLLHLLQNPNPNALMGKMAVKMINHPWLKFPPRLPAKRENHVINVIHLSHKSDPKVKLI